jgi:hypothetical protein
MLNYSFPDFRWKELTHEDVYHGDDTLGTDINKKWRNKFKKTNVSPCSLTFYLASSNSFLVTSILQAIQFLFNGQISLPDVVQS